MSDEKISRKKCSSCKKFVILSEEKIKNCPHCNALYWDKPLDERKLFELQDRFLSEGRNPKVLEKMYPILKNYVKFLLLKMLKGKVKIPSYEIENKVNDVIRRLVVYYISSKDWVISISFAGILKFGIIEVLYGDKKNDSILSLNYKIGQRKDKDLNDVISLDNSDVLYNDFIYKQNLLSGHLLDFIKSYLMEVRYSIGERAYLYLLFAIKFLLHNKDYRFLDKYYDFAGIDTQIKATELFNAIKNEIKNYANR